MQTKFSIKEESQLVRPKDVIYREVIAIVDVVSVHFGVSKEAICGNNRNALGSKCRFICMYLMIQIPELSLSKVANHFGRANHTTTLHAISSVAQMIKENDAYRDDIIVIIDRLNESLEQTAK
jgi:chromosomal replication initiation ATPase DnaA